MLPIRRGVLENPRVSSTWPSLFDRLEQELVSNWSRQGGQVLGGLDVFEEAERFVVQLDAPGVTKENIDLSLEDRVLTINIERPEPSQREGRKYLHQGREIGSFSRTLSLPASAGADVSASLQDGVLTLTIEKAPEQRPRKIEIQ